MAARTVFLLLLLPALPPATPDTPGPDCRLRCAGDPALPRGDAAAPDRVSRVLQVRHVPAGPVLTLE
ncbi:hypothetical protein DUI87_33056 [Hirundo rustica rustica]|uniref:Selenoprotein P N-terminal domain-containing protein n=1 Tax=Hirundo rustica rustica TaxID=333673 RepID=A0A3M0IP58_HIRRU|nr:hypothetical protein DUI87_33056 [Hirundo rustica rustica]